MSSHDKRLLLGQIQYNSITFITRRQSVAQTDFQTQIRCLHYKCQLKMHLLLTLLILLHFLELKRIQASCEDLFVISLFSEHSGFSLSLLLSYSYGLRITLSGCEMKKKKQSLTVKCCFAECYSENNSSVFSLP